MSIEIPAIEIPGALIASYTKSVGSGPAGRAWLAALPELAADVIERRRLRVIGDPMHGMGSLVLPVVLEDGTRAALKLQPVDEENASEPVGLRVWDGDGIVRLLDEEPGEGVMLLEWLDPARPLSAMEDDDAAVLVVAELLARLVAVPAPAGMRHLRDIAAAMLDEVPTAVEKLRDPAERRLVRACAGAVGELVAEPGDRLLHWDLHYDNVLAAEREPWLAIDPKPLAGDPGFDLLPALRNRWDEAVAAGDPARATLRRFDLMTEVLGLDRRRAAGWSLGRVLQNALWDVEDGEEALDPAQVVIGEALAQRWRS